MEPPVILSLAARMKAFRSWRAAIILIALGALGFNTWHIATIVRTLDAIATQNVHLKKPWSWSEQTIDHDVTTFWVASAMTY